MPLERHTMCCPECGRTDTTYWRTFSRDRANPPGRHIRRCNPRDGGCDLLVQYDSIEEFLDPNECNEWGHSPRRERVVGNRQRHTDDNTQLPEQTTKDL